ncbi:MAG: homoserine kinase [Tepidimonas sp.]|uniref:homoserine kinase n=1 Tax=Tepidimonas sp. TaxID=2002775 RepID=UPI00259DA8B2|nr:homoserine kinase [Tepidimonas sp.]MDM7456867.1 homoserine kinase [Tepidimonas sp.]
MAVFTEVGRDEAADLMQRLGLGRLVDMAGCAGGIENTNYFVSSERDGQRHEWVLTLFERLSAQQLPFYLYLMKHLAGKGIPVPDPQADANGAILHTVRGKPAAVVNRLHGHHEPAPGPEHCAQLGAMLARMHLAGQDYEREQPNLRGLAWWNETAPVILPHLTPEQAALLTAELAYQNHVAASPAYQALPRGPIHADLFRDNVMFEDGRLSGLFDFYFAGCDTWLFDIAVCLNDWCIDLTRGATDPVRTQALLDAYQSIRPLTAAERELLPAMRRAGALRFWISRLWDWYLPRQAAVLKPHDPTHFERVLRARLAEC